MKQKFERDKQGNNRYVRIDLRKYGKEIEPFLQKLSLEHDSQFQDEWDKAISSDEFKKQMHSRIKKWFNI